MQRKKLEPNEKRSGISAPFFNPWSPKTEIQVLVVVIVLFFVMTVGMTAAVIFVFFETGLVAHFAIAIPVVVMVETSARAVPIAAEITAAFMAGSNPSRAGIRWTAPIAFVPAIVAGNRIPIAADPHKVGCRLRGHDDDGAWRGWSADLNPDGYLTFGRNTCQQECRKGGSFQQISHD